MSMLRKNIINDSNVKLIFGLKLRQLRQDKRLLLTDLSKLSGISVSYLNEIEKGKKFPKAHKIASLAEALGVSYDWLTSLHMKQSLAPVSKLLQSKILHELPLDVFGINRGQLLELLSAAPVKLNAFLSTLIEISRNYGLRIEHFYYSALRSYQEMRENYFEEIETAVEEFARANGIDRHEPVSLEKIKQILTLQYDFQVIEGGLSLQPELQSLKSILLPGKPSRYLLNETLTENQKAFILAREIGFQCLNIYERSNTSPPVQVDSFEQVLNNFNGSYFACALLLNKDHLINKLQTLFDNRNFNPATLLSMIEEFRVSSEVFAHRITNVLPRFFGIQELFFLRMTNEKNSDVFELTKEIHLSGLHDPHVNMQHEYYCRRWVSITILKDLCKQIETSGSTISLCKAQRSKYFGSDKEYLIISLAKPSNSLVNHSISIGLLLTDSMKKKVKFWNDPSIPIRMVGETCERCPATDCQERQTAPIQYLESQRVEHLKFALRALAEE
jgi:transcriptional regulator with XRE-family HTH domain